MKEFVFTKTLGVIVGTLTILLAIGFGLLSFIGMSLGNALNSNTDHSTTYILPIVLVLVLLGVITAMGSFWLKGKSGRIFYIGFSFIMGIALIVIYFPIIGCAWKRRGNFHLICGNRLFTTWFFGEKEAIVGTKNSVQRHKS